MKRKIILFILIALSQLVFKSSLIAQELSQEQLVKRFSELDSLYLKNYKKNNLNSFKKDEIVEYLKVYYEQHDLLQKIKGHEELKFKFFKQKGNQFRRLKLYKESNKNFYLSFYYFSRLKQPVNHHLKSYNYGTFGEMAENYLHLNKKDSVYMQYKKGITFSQLKMQKRILQASALNNLGIFFSEQLQQYDSAMYYLTRAQKEMGAIDDLAYEFFEGSIRDNIANVYVGKNQLKKAKELYTKNFSFFNPSQYQKEYRDYYRWIRSGIQLAEMHIKLEEPKQGSFILDSVNKLLSTYKFKERNRLRLRTMEAKRMLYYLKGAYKKAYSYTQKSKALKDSIEREASKNEVLWSTLLKNTAISRLKENIAYETKRKKEEAERNRNHLIVALLFLTLSVITLIFIFNVYKRKRLLNKKSKIVIAQNNQMLDLQNEILKKKAEVKKRDLTDFAINITQNELWVKDFAKHIEKVKSTRGRARVKEIDELYREVKTKIQFDERTKDFYEKIDKLSNAFYDHLKTYASDLTKTEIKLATMIRLGFNNQKIAMLQNIDLNSVHQSRYKLKKKLNINEDLDDFIKKL